MAAVAARPRAPVRSHPGLDLKVAARATLQRRQVPPGAAAAAPPGRRRRRRRGASLAAGRRPLQQQQAGERYFAADSRPIILFDGVCNLCNGGVNFMLAWDQAGAFRLAALQSEAGRALLQRAGRSPEDISSIVLVERQQAYIKSEAVLRIAAGLRAPLPALAALGFPFPLPFRDTVYDAIADNRYLLFGETNTCRLSEPRFEDRFLS